MSVGVGGGGGEYRSIILRKNVMLHCEHDNFFYKVRNIYVLQIVGSFEVFPLVARTT